MFNFAKKLVGIGLIESFVDNFVKDTVRPVPGCIVHCELLLGLGDHSGIYVGNNQIVHLDGSGIIVSVTPEEFLGRLNGYNSAMTIYVSCHNGNPVGSETVAKRALSKIRQAKDYNLIWDNCHQFTSGCVTGLFTNSDTFFWMLEHTAKEELLVKEWRAWDRDSKRNFLI